MEPIVISGLVRARLLGIPLLTLAARIVAESPELDVVLIPSAAARGPSHQAVGEPGTGVARARQLVREAGALTTRV